jgi:hypothetical protein
MHLGEIEWGYWLDLSGCGYEQVESFFECCNERSGSINFWEFLCGFTTADPSGSAQLHRLNEVPHEFHGTASVV